MPEIHALLVMHPERREHVTLMLEGAGVRAFSFASTFEQARRALKADAPVQLIVTTPAVGDGKWADLLAHARQNNTNIEFVVWSGLPHGRALRKAGRRGDCRILPASFGRRDVEGIVEAVALRTQSASVPLTAAA